MDLLTIFNRIGRSAVSCLFLMALGVMTVQAQGTITGIVYDQDSKEVLAGANVVLEGTSQGTTTNEEGRFTLEDIAEGDYTMRISFVGFQPAEISIEVDEENISIESYDIEVDINETPEIQVFLEAGEELGEISVTGLRRGQVQSIGQKRDAINIVDAISADEVGKLPDLNVAESAQRIPGVTIRTDRGEGRFVSIRGTAPNRSNVSFNGQAMASSAGTRATALDLVPSEMVSSIEVTKAVTPDMDANALGGSVNISTLTAFDRAGSFLSASLNGMYHQLTTDYGDTPFPYRSSLTAGTRFGPDKKWGIVLSGTASRRAFNTSVFSGDDWVQVEGGGFAPEGYQMEVEDNDRKRYSVNANLDFRPATSTSLFLRLHHSQRKEQFSNLEVQFDDGSIVPESDTRGRYENFQSEFDMPLTNIDEKLYALTLGAEQGLGSNISWEVEGTYTRGERDRFTHQPEWGLDQGFSLSYDLSSELPSLAFDNLEEVGNPENYVFDEMDIEFEDLRENTWQIATDLQWDLQFDEGAGFIKTGGQFLIRDKDIDENENPWAQGSELFTLAQFYKESPSISQSNAIMPIAGDTPTFLNFWRQNNGNDTYFFLDPVESREEEVERDAIVTEDVYAGYVMGNIEISSFTATGGVRIEATNTTADRSRFIVDDELDESQITFEKASNEYVNFLPSLHLIYRFSDRMQVRGSWSNTLGRPDYDELAAFQDVEFESAGEGVWQANIVEGNPDLKPLKAMNLDFSAEYYSGLGGLISLGAFYKNITDPIYMFDFTERDLQGSELGIDIQDIPGFNDRFFSEVNYEQLRNADSGSIWGLEASFMQIFDFLPGFLSGIGLSSNAAIMGSEVTVPGREGDDLPFFDQSDFVYNLVPYYQYGKLQLRVAMNYQSEYLTSVASEGFEDTYDDERFTIDLSGRYEFLDGRLQLNAYLRNLTNEAERSFQNRRRWLTDHELTGRTFEVGLSLRL